MRCPVLAVWIDHSLAKIIEVDNGNSSQEILRERHVDHHTDRLDELDRKRFEHKYFGEVAQKLKSANTILLLGPGVEKYHFQNYLREQNPALGRKIVACETVNHIADSQLLVLAKALFDSSGRHFR